MTTVLIDYIRPCFIRSTFRSVCVTVRIQKDIRILWRSKNRISFD